MRCPYETGEGTTEAGCATTTTVLEVTPLPELILEPGHPATQQIIETDVSVPPTVELAWTGDHSETLGVIGACLLMTGVFLIWLKTRMAS